MILAPKLDSELTQENCLKFFSDYLRNSEEKKLKKYDKLN
jgi:hypothetical protein